MSKISSSALSGQAIKQNINKKILTKNRRKMKDRNSQKKHLYN
jgi:hypothetical protein